jgi:hypothetical protein
MGSHKTSAKGLFKPSVICVEPYLRVQICLYGATRRHVDVRSVKTDRLTADTVPFHDRSVISATGRTV